MLEQTSNLSTWELLEARKSRVQGQPELPRKTQKRKKKEIIIEASLLDLLGIFLTVVCIKHIFH